MVIVALPVPEPEQLPLAVMLTGKPELAVAATEKVSPNSALPGAGVVTVMVCAVPPTLVVDVTSGAGS